MIIKYPNWYEHFHGLGYDLAEKPTMFDAIYTGTETRDPIITDQLLQQYESYEIYRYFSNIRPGANLGVWADTFGTRAIDRYAEQLWDGLFAKAPEQMLFNWRPMAEDAAGAGRNAAVGEAEDHLRLDRSPARIRTPAGRPPPTQRCMRPTRVLGDLGKPVGIASYRPPHATGEDFLHNYIGNLGVPIELYPDYPSDAHTILLTEAAATDPQIIAKINASLHGGSECHRHFGLPRSDARPAVSSNSPNGKRPVTPSPSTSISTASARATARS